MSKAQSLSDPGQEAPEAIRPPHDCYEAEILFRIWRRLHHKNEHFVMAIVGREGSGKSFTSMRLADEIDPTFNVDRVIFDIGELIQLLKDGDHEPGNAYVLDEAGVSLGRRTWQERGQILANQAMQLIRSHNLALFFTLPALGELDSQTQNRLQAFYEITDKVPDEYVEGKWKYIDPDRTGQRGYDGQKYPRMWANGVKKRVTRLKFTPPDPGLVDEYLQEKSKHQQEFYEETLAELGYGDDEEQDDEADTAIDVKAVADEIIEEGVDEFVSIHGGNKQPYIDSGLIEIEYDTSRRNSKKIKTLLEKKLGGEVPQPHTPQG